MQLSCTFTFDRTTELFRQHGPVVRAPGLCSINMVSVQNLLVPFCCVLGKNTLLHFPLRGGLGKQF